MRGAAFGILGTALLLVPLAAAEPPRRVVSANLCTDQLAMLIAAPGQLVSVSHVARDPVSSAMAAEAEGFAVNHGTAEEIFLLAPDLVLAGEYLRPDARLTLERMGLRVETFRVDSSFDDVRANIARMGALLGREARAAELVEALDAALVPPPPGPRPTAALFYANAYTSGAGTLADEILRQAGLDNLAARRGVSGLARLPLELLALEAPDLLVIGQDYATPALAQAVLRHPVARALGSARTAVADNLWVCGLPQTAQAVTALRAWAEGRAEAPQR
jgi:iron complex transport system substrate-binding protein